MQPSLMGPAFEPWERFLLLSRAAEEIRPERAAEVLPHVLRTAGVVLRSLRGKATHAEAYAHIERTRQLLEEARRP